MTGSPAIPTSDKSSASFAAAAMIAGRLMRNTNRAAESRRNPKNMLTISVEPDRDSPGASAAACATPMASASP